MFTTTMQLAAQAAAHGLMADVRQREVHFEFNQDDTPGLKKSKHPNRHPRSYNSDTNRRGRRGSSFFKRR